ncbi:MAG: HNH endonuclease signature motif containing protein [Planctomycetaceae bacterium]
MRRTLEDRVWRRANSCCDYCRIPHEFDPLPFQIDHIIARQHGGRTSFDNLALACLACNNHKGPNIAGIDPEGSEAEVVRLFRPHADEWHSHFEWDGPVLRGKTAEGRATIHVLGINLAHRVALRKSLIAEGVLLSDS